MAYLGRALTSGNYLKLDDISSQFNGSTKTFNLTSGGQAFYPGSPYSILVSIASSIQEPESAFQINESQIVFTTAPSSSDSFFCLVLGVAVGIGVPGDGTVSPEKLTSAAKGVGINSAGTTIGAGVTQLNFVGAGNTFSYNALTNTVDISIAGGGNAGAGGTWSSNAVGVHTTKIVGVGTDAIAGAANSEGALQAHGNVAIIDGALLTDIDVNSNVFIPSGKNGLLIGPVTVGVGLTVDVASGSVLVVV